MRLLTDDVILDQNVIIQALCRQSDSSLVFARIMIILTESSIASLPEPLALVISNNKNQKEELCHLPLYLDIW